MNSLFLCKDLVNEPGNKLNPSNLCSLVKKIISKENVGLKHKIKIREYDDKDLKKMDMNLLYSVGKYSRDKSKSKLLVIEYICNKSKPIILLGKGCYI